MDKHNVSVATRVKHNKRRWSLMGVRCHNKSEHSDDDAESTIPAATTTEGRPASRQKFLTDPVEIIKEKIGSHQHHGTGNPLAVRSPETPPDLAIQNLAEIIRNGTLGKATVSASSAEAAAEASTNSLSTMAAFKTERGNTGSFWTNKVRLAGGYGWTGLILQPNVDTSYPLPVVENAVWFVVEHEDELTKLRTLVIEGNHLERWNAVKDRVVTLVQLAEHLKD
eukprot:scaffold4341_cov161-Amphora_coffeaeformis.AAC.4